MKNKKPKNHHKSQITRQILLQYTLALIGFAFGFAFLIFFLWSICNRFVWYDTNPLYKLLKFVKDYILLFAAIPSFIAWILITYRFISKPLRYLDEIIAASEKLTTAPEEPIILHSNMKGVQDELNSFREHALRNATLAKEAEQRKNDLIVYLAHDLKTPLTSVIGYLTLLRDEAQISEELREKYLSISLAKAERLEDLINEFFEITRFNLSNIDLEYSNVNLTRLLEQLTFEFKPMLLEKNLEFNLNIAADTMIKCDVNKMQRVFDNLCRNAVFYSFENSAIEITALQNENNIEIKVLNHGNTIPNEKLQRIFEQFYRLDTSRGSNNGGAGLGLAIAKEIVELHHGTISARSENEIVEFQVTIPLS